MGLDQLGIMLGQLGGLIFLLVFLLELIQLRVQGLVLLPQILDGSLLGLDLV